MQVRLRNLNEKGSFRSVFVFAVISLITSTGTADDRMIAATTNLVGEDGTVKTIVEAMNSRGLPGLSVAVIDNSEIVWTAQWGVKENGTSDIVDKETMFSTASISKPITATLFAMLEEKGLIDLDAPAGNYLKRWQLPDNEYTKEVPITLRHLLSHTAGTNQRGFVDYYVGDELPTLVDVLNGTELAQTERLQVDCVPGTKWRYSGGGYVIAQMAVEDQLGIPLAELAERHLFRQLGMSRTTMRQPGEEGFPANAAKAHDENGNVISTGLPVCPQTAPSGMWSTPTDMAKLLIEMQSALQGSKTKVISPAVAKLVTTEIRDGFGLGWALFEQWGGDHNKWFAHGGANTGTGGHIRATFENGRGVAFFANSPNETRFAVFGEFMESIVDAHGWNVPGNHIPVNE